MMHSYARNYTNKTCIRTEVVVSQIEDPMVFSLKGEVVLGAHDCGSAMLQPSTGQGCTPQAADI